MKRGWSVVAVAAGLLALWASPSEAMQLEVTRAQLCGVSAAVALVEVGEIETHWASGPDGGIERHALVEVQQVIKGAAPKGATIVLPGGEIENLRHWVEDVPELEVGARYVVFLNKLAEGYEVIGGEAGAIQVASATDWRGEAVDDVIVSMEGCHAR